VVLRTVNAKSQIQHHPGEDARIQVASQRSDDLRDFADRLRSVSERARKLLVSIAELAYHGRGQQRKEDVAYLPELYESCGLGVEEMYPLLEELKKARFIDVEDQYPFEDVKILRTAAGWNALRDISRIAESGKTPLRNILVDLHFELLQ
jgi:hypothetical protein